MSAPDGGKVRLIKSAYGVLNRLLKNLDGDYKLEIAHVDQVVMSALQQHGEHLRVHQIEQKSIDAFKLVCWLGGSLLDGIEVQDNHQCGVIIDAIIRTLEELLIIETESNLILPYSAASLLKSMLMQEKARNPRHGIWMNGLYVAFHCGRVAWREGQAYKVPL